MNSNLWTPYWNFIWQSSEIREKFSLDTLLAPNSLEEINGFAVPSTFEFVGRNKLCCLWYRGGRIAADIFRSICGGIFDFRQTSKTCYAARVNGSRGVLRVIMRLLRISIVPEDALLIVLNRCRRNITVSEPNCYHARLCIHNTYKTKSITLNWQYSQVIFCISSKRTIFIFILSLLFIIICKNIFN